MSIEHLSQATTLTGIIYIAGMLCCPLQQGQDIQLDVFWTNTYNYAGLILNDSFLHSFNKCLQSPWLSPLVTFPLSQNLSSAISKHAAAKACGGNADLV